MALDEQDIKALKEVFAAHDEDPVTRVSKTIPGWAYAVGISVLGFIGTLLFGALIWMLQAWITKNEDVPERLHIVESQMAILIKDQEERKQDSASIQKLLINVEAITEGLKDLKSKSESTYSSEDAKADQIRLRSESEKADEANAEKINELRISLKSEVGEVRSNLRDRTLFMEALDQRLRKIEITNGVAPPK